MKKLLILPLAATLCFACSKSGPTDSPLPPVAQKAAASATDVIAVSNMIDYDRAGSDSYVDYTDAAGQSRTVCLNDHLSPDIEILAGTPITFRLHIWPLDGGKLYAALRNETFVDDDCIYHNTTSGGVYANLTTLTEVDTQVVIKRPFGQISIWAGTEDFSEGALDSGEFCWCPN